MRCLEILRDAVALPVELADRTVRLGRDGCTAFRRRRRHYGLPLCHRLGIVSKGVRIQSVLVICRKRRGQNGQ